MIEPAKDGAIWTYECPTLASFLDLYSEHYLGNKAMIFRGHARWDWELKSSLRRELEKHDPEEVDLLIRHPRRFAPGFQEFVDHMYITGSDSIRALVDEYQQLYQRAGSTETKQYRDERIRQRLNDDYTPVDPEVTNRQERLRVLDGKILGLAQHYGLPTPLIDWTYSPFVAWFFALADVAFPPDRPQVVAMSAATLQGQIDSYVTAEIERRKEGALKASRPPDRGDFSDLVELERFCVVDGFLPENDRFVAQSGVLTNQSVRFSLEEIARMTWQGDDTPCIVRFELGEQRETALRILRRMNVHGGTLFPGPAGGARLGLDSIRFENYSGLKGALLPGLV